MPPFEPSTTSARSRLEAGVLTFAMLFPLVSAWFYFVVCAGQDSARWSYGLGKGLQFGLPLVWVFVVLREPFRVAHQPGEARWPLRVSYGLAIGFSLAVLGLMAALYFGWLRGSEMLSGTRDAIDLRLRGYGLSSPGGFLVMAGFISLIHSFLEEYYWRWFVHRRLRPKLGEVAANALSSLAFMGHHIVIVAVYVSDLRWVALLSLSVAVGGSFWAWLYDRTGSLAPVWISHVLLDLGIMLIGYDLLWGSLVEGR